MTLIGVSDLEKVIELIYNSLKERRRLSDKEMLIIIELLLKEYKIINNVNRIDLDYDYEYDEIAGFDNYNKVLYFNMCLINSTIFSQYTCERSFFSFSDFFLLEQLATIFHEIRHIIQLNDEFKNKEILKKIILDSDINKYPFDLYNLNHSLFPTEKDAKVFSIDKTIDIIKETQFFNDDIIHNLYVIYFYTLIGGYNLKESNEGSLREFYQKIVGDEKVYFERLTSIDSLTTHDKMSFNLPINQDDRKNLLAVPDFIYRGINPSVILKKKIKRR